MGPMDGPGLKGQSTGGWKTWSAKKKLLILVSILLIFIVALAVGLGVGLGIGLGKGGGGGEEGGDNNPPPTNDNGTTAKWQPAVGTTWHIQLFYPINDTSVDMEVYDIDLFDNPKSMIDELHSLGRKVICYFSAGTYEDWRPDQANFRTSDIGARLSQWDGENWLDIRSNSVREIMLSRLDMARAKGCDGVDPDNVDGYNNHNGLDLTMADSINYVNWLANSTHARGMSIGLKNAGAIIPHVINNMQWSVNEQCVQYSECSTYSHFWKADKPIFHLEYPKGADTNNKHPVTRVQKERACNFEGSGNFSTLIKNMDLDQWYETC